jgi:hypothetical protein
MLDTVKRLLGPTPGWLRVVALAPIALLVAGCAQVGTNQITFWDIIWSMSVFFLWLIFIWMFVALFMDVMRRHDIGGGKKVGWIFFMLILPFIGILCYIAFRPANIGYLGMGGQAETGVSSGPTNKAR